MHRSGSSIVLTLAIAAALGTPRQARASDVLRDGLEGSLRGCEAWVLEPSTWSDGVAPFLARIGLGERMSEAKGVAEALLPPPSLRRDNRFWRISAGPSDSYTLAVSEGIPMCHITGGGGSDHQPVAEAVLASPEFAARWERIADEEPDNGIVSTLFRSREERALTLLVSRAEAPGARRDRPQVVATAFYDLQR